MFQVEVSLLDQGATAGAVDGGSVVDDHRVEDLELFDGWSRGLFRSASCDHHMNAPI